MVPVTVESGPAGAGYKWTLVKEGEQPRSATDSGSPAQAPPQAPPEADSDPWGYSSGGNSAMQVLAASDLPANLQDVQRNSSPGGYGCATSISFCPVAWRLADPRHRLSAKG